MAVAERAEIEAAGLLQCRHLGADAARRRGPGPRTGSARSSRRSGCPSTGEVVGDHLAHLVACRSRSARRQDVVDVGGDHQPLDRQAHALGARSRRRCRRSCRSARRTTPAGAARRARRRRRSSSVTWRDDARPVDGVDAGERHAIAEAGSLNIAFTSAWQSSNVPSTATACTLARSASSSCAAARRRRALRGRG